MIIGILIAVFLMFTLVLAALIRHPDAPILVLVMLTTCLRYGHRDEPDDLVLLPRRPYQTSLGSCP